MKLTVAAVQLKPKIGDLENNIKKASSIISSLPSKPDLIVLPELAFTGYNFHSPQHIKPFLEPFHSSLKQKISPFDKLDNCPSISWAIQTAKANNCFTLVGYPETFNGIIYNSGVLVSPAGTIIFNYRKSFLYEADVGWGCEENPNGFEVFKLNLNKQYYKNRLAKGIYAEQSVLDQVEGIKKKKVDGMVCEDTKVQNGIDGSVGDDDNFVNASIGICMDLNNYEFRTDFTKFELADFCFENDVQLMLLPMAWLSPAAPKLSTQTAEDKQTKIEYFNTLFDKEDPYVIATESSQFETFEGAASYEKNSVDLSNLNYWILRCVPLYNNAFKIMKRMANNNKNRAVVICNRTGIEDDVVYGGTSSVIEFGPETFDQTSFNKFLKTDASNPSVHVKGSLPTGCEGALVSQIDI